MRMPMHWEALSGLRRGLMGAFSPHAVNVIDRMSLAGAGSGRNGCRSLPV